MALEKLDRVKAERVSRFLWDAKTVGLKVKKVYSKTSVTGKFCLMVFMIALFVVIILLNEENVASCYSTGYAIDTKEDEGWFAGSLYYVHMALMCMSGHAAVGVCVP